MKTIILVAMPSNRIIGREGRIPWHDSDDLKFFRRTTTGHAVIMGRRTYESIGKPLPDRQNIVITRRSLLTAPPGVDIVHSLDDALDACRRRDQAKAFIIGGGQIYALAMPIADEMLITHIDGDDMVGDTYFPPWSPAQWRACGPVDPAFPQAIRYLRRGR
jgi:dihydrofolate reductase